MRATLDINNNSKRRRGVSSRADDVLLGVTFEPRYKLQLIFMPF